MADSRMEAGNIQNELGASWGPEVRKYSTHSTHTHTYTHTLMKKGAAELKEH